MSDPSVRAMTAFDWRFEYEALRRRDDAQQAQWRVGVRVLRETLVNVLGLNLLAPQQRAGAVALPPDPDGLPPPTPYLPAALVLSDPALLKAALEEKEREEAAAPAADDAAFDAYSAAVHERVRAGEDVGAVGDMEPMTADEAMAHFGLEPRDPSEPPVPHASLRVQPVGADVRVLGDSAPRGAQAGVMFDDDLDVAPEATDLG